jgi:hypothetical protein
MSEAAAPERTADMDEKKMMKIWDCKIGEIDAEKLPPGADAPMRAAIERTYYLLTGEYPQFIFSGWGGELTEGERRVVDRAASDTEA